MTRLNLTLALLLACGVSACGHSGNALSPAERAAASQRRERERPHFASRSLAATGRRHHALLTELRRSVLHDARARVARHELRGPVLGVACNVTRDDEAYAKAHPAAPILRYDCLAISFRGRTDPPMLLGSQFEARVNFARGSYAWCLFTPVGGEGAHSAATFHVTPSPACVAPPTAAG